VNRDEILQGITALEARVTQMAEAKLGRYAPYFKQMLFHASGLTNSQRLFQAPNRAGKSQAGAAEVAMHMTGIYPEWWTGRRFTTPATGWLAGESEDAIRQTAMKHLLGTETPINQPHLVGTGFLPKDSIVKVIQGRGGADRVATLIVKHTSGANSTLGVKTYQQERGIWQGAGLDFLWFDEEPPIDLYIEGLARLFATNGIAFTTFTPLKGRSAVIALFYDEEVEGRAVIKMSAGESAHLTGEMITKMRLSIPLHEQLARIDGEISQGEGAVWTIPVGAFTTPRIPINRHWKLILGMDFGINKDHPQAMAWLAHDTDRDIVYLYDHFRQSDCLVPSIAAFIRSRGEGIPVAWPQDGLERDKTSGLNLAEQYRRSPHNINMLPSHATWPEGGYGHAAFVSEFQARLETGRFMVFDDQRAFLDEYIGYYRKDNKIVKRHDDLISAVKCGIMMLRYAKSQDRIGARLVRGPVRVKNAGNNYDPFSGQAIGQCT
jgi:phage terminase large subunit-like protein